MPLPTSLVASSSGLPTLSPGNKRSPEQGSQQHVQQGSDSGVKRQRACMRALDVLEPPRPAEELDSSYYPSTSIPIRGWLQPCRYCRQWTSGTVSTTNPDPVPVCQRCQCKLAEYFKAVLQVKRAQKQENTRPQGGRDVRSPSMSQAWSSPSTSPSTLALETSLSI